MSSDLSDPDGPAASSTATSAREVTLHQLLQAAVEQGASDLHVTVGAPPCLRVGGEMVSLRTEPLGPRDTARLCQQVLSEAQVERFAASHALRMSFGVPGLARFRGSFFMQRSAMAGAYRVVPFAVPRLDALGLSMVEPLTTLERGLVLVGGPLASGKSTTMAALVSAIARRRAGHLITLEDPIEYQFPHEGSSLIAQIEVGTDYTSFEDAFAAAMAQDPDVLMISEATGLPAIEGALEAAEAGRLVIAASPSRSIAKAIARVVDAYPADAQARARARLADVLEAVTCQSVERGGNGRRVACELLVADASLRARVRDGSALLE